MPGGNITNVDRHKRLVRIKELKDEGKKTKQIAKELSLPIATVERSINYLKELSISDLTPADVGEKRGELYLELLEETRQAKGAYDQILHIYKEEREAAVREARAIANGDEDIPAFKATIGTTDIRRLFKSWLEAIDLRMKLYGLDSQKVGAVNVINNQTNYIEPEKMDVVSANKIADMLKRNHEKSRR